MILFVKFVGGNYLLALSYLKLVSDRMHACMDIVCDGPTTQVLQGTRVALLEQDYIENNRLCVNEDN